MSKEKNILEKFFQAFNIKKYLNSNPENKLLAWDELEKNFYRIKCSNLIKFDDLLHINRQKEILFDNTKLFCAGKPSNNALLWGARGTGKSSLVLSIFKEITKKYNLSILEVKTNQIKILESILRKLNIFNNKFIIFCDDFSFSANSEKFIIFKNILDGSISKNKNYKFYVTSNYRNLIKDEPILNNTSMLDKQENIDNQTALSDRFGLWLGFQNFDEKQYLQIVKNYCRLKKINYNKLIEKKAIQWSLLRGSRSGREALHFVIGLYNNKI